MPTLSRILCPVDLSEASKHSVAHAAALARWYGARVVALHVESPITQRLPEVPDERRAHESDLEHVRGRIEEGLREFGVSLVDFDLRLDLGEPVPHILQRAETLPADLIVMGTHGMGGFERFVLGSVAEKVLRRAPCDVLVVPPKANATSRLPYMSILCGVDFSSTSLKALDVACDIASESGALLTVMHVIPWPWDEPPAPEFHRMSPEQASALREYRRYLEAGATTRLRDLLMGKGDLLGRATVLVRHGSAHREILREASEGAADLVVLGVQGRGRLGVALFGSTANQVVRQATCPVWIVRETER